MKGRKVWSMTVSLVLSLSLIAGCAGGTGTEPSNDGGGQAETSKTNEPAAPAAGGSASAEPLELQFMVPSYSDVPDMNDEYWSEWQKRTNTKLDVEWIPSGDYDTKFDLVLASGNLPEILVATSATRPTLLSAIKQGAFWDLTPFFGDFSEYPNLKNNSEPNVWNYLKVDGKIYGIPRNRPHIDVAINIRKDWLDKFNLPVPTTIDEYANALKTIVKGDPDGNGKNDTIGILGHGFLLDDGDNNYMGPFGALDPVFNEQGGLVKDNLTTNYTEMVAWFRDLYANGVLAKEFSAIKKTQAEEMFATGRAASYARNIWRDYTWEQEIRKVQPEAELITLPPLEGPRGNSAGLATPFFGAMYISKKVPEEKVKQILAYMDMTATQEYTDFNYYGIENVHHTVVDGQPQLTELGKKQVTTNANQVFAMAYNNKMKVVNPSAPKAYNDAKMESVKIFAEVGKINIFSVISSDTWTAEWPKYQAEWESMVVKAIVGQISMEEYQAYVDGLNGKPEIQKAYQEFAQAYKEKIGN
ncbi:extracellular solute-binding protein [Paenibacillus sp.]|uniref:extracellular solute-binding protein n=1 Tax=Paenibacillus sp. TaxID=58172 RepID=UPI002D3A3512|nr:extracellular solute-binding protein [Paenibacillus sp.]HZG86699.1 extracellular solute-binding protein [Paenibacillus sp.]